MSQQPLVHRPPEAKFNKTIIIVAFIIAFICLIPIGSNLLSPVDLNSRLLRIIPMGIGLILLCIPFAMRYGMIVNDNVDTQDFIRESGYRKQIAINKISFVIRIKNDDEFTRWEISSTDHFEWKGAIVVLERIHGNFKQNDRIELGNIGPFERLIVSSKLEDLPGSRWRVMICAQEGYGVRLPNRWRELDMEKLNTSQIIDPGGL